MPISYSQIVRLDKPDVVSLFELYLGTNANTVIRFTNERVSIRWQGFDYFPIPCQFSSFEKRGEGTEPRPKLRISNAGNVVSVALRDIDPTGLVFIRRRTLRQYLDDGETPSDAEYSPDYFEVQTCENNDPQFLDVELSSPLDLDGLELPREKVFRLVCRFTYRGERCGYGGPPVADSNDKPTTDPTKDDCSRYRSGCKKRFPSPQELPFGGFPAVIQYSGSDSSN